MKSSYDVIIIGAGAAGMMCAIEAAKRGRRVWLIDHAKKIAEKIRIAGGGRCNFTNIHTKPDAFLSRNRHFCKSALNQYTQDDFIALVQSHDIAFHEKKLGQLFCDISSQQIIDMLLRECDDAGVELEINVSVQGVAHQNNEYVIETSHGRRTCSSLVIATGGLSIPKIGASKFGYDIAKQFGINVVETNPALVPLTFQDALLEQCKALSGLSVEATVSCGKTSFSEGLLFTHRGLSGPSILQISSYWKEGAEIIINLAPQINVDAFLRERKQTKAKQEIQNVLAEILPKRLAQSICEALEIAGNLGELSDHKIAVMAAAVNQWRIKPSGTEGYRTAEVTLGGVDTNDVSSKTMEVKKQPGLFFIGEVLDVTGHLGGYNFQWAWSSGFVAGQSV